MHETLRVKEINIDFFIDTNQKRNEHKFPRFKGLLLSILNNKVNFPALLNANHSINKLKKLMEVPCCLN